MSQQINLLSPDLRQRRELVSAFKVMRAVLVLLLLLGVAALWSGERARSREARSQDELARLKTAKEQLAALHKELAARQPNDQLTLELAAATSQLKGREEVMAYLERGGVGSAAGFAQFLRGLARQTQSGLWLTGFSVAEGGRDMEIRGRTLAPAAVPDYIGRLNSEAAFHGRSFAALEIKRGETDARQAAATPSRYVEFALSSKAPGETTALAEKKP